LTGWPSEPTMGKMSDGDKITLAGELYLSKTRLEAEVGTLRVKIEHTARRVREFADLLAKVADGTQFGRPDGAYVRGQAEQLDLAGMGAVIDEYRQLMERLAKVSQNLADIR
jgi:hypothetical protein